MIPKFWFRLAWAGWVLQGIVMEVIAIAFLGSQEATLSAAVWWLFATVQASPFGAVGVALLSILMIGFFGWVSLHFLQKLIAKQQL